MWPFKQTIKACLGMHWDMHSFPMLYLSLPGYYCKAIDIWNASNPNKPLIECSRDTLTIQPYDDKSVSGPTLDQVTNHLIHHGIPLQWIDHTYTFGLHYLNHQSYLWAGPFQDLYCQMDCKYKQCLESMGIPEAIPQWDGWWCPSYDDITRIQYLLSRKDNVAGKSCFLDFKWLPAGAPAIFQELTGHMLRTHAAPTTSGTPPQL